MSQLIQIRRRIRAIETIKKITHAMRLISMSTHSRLNKKQTALKVYKDKTAALFDQLQHHVPSWNNSLMHPDTQSHKHPLIIIIGSHRGLCGTFNSTLFTYFSEHIHKNKHKKTTCISIGKKATEFLQSFKTMHTKLTFTNLTGKTFVSIAHSIAQHIIHTPTPYSSVVVLSNAMKSFFVQYPHATQLIPFIPPALQTKTNAAELLWYDEPHVVLDHIAYLYLESQLQSVIFESLLAEHAARFISMDNSTRNAQTILESTRLRYNKLRQSNITKELTELAGSF